MQRDAHVNYDCNNGCQGRHFSVTVVIVRKFRVTKRTGLAACYSLSFLISVLYDGLYRGCKG